jgi:hypothetical protein
MLDTENFENLNDYFLLIIELTGRSSLSQGSIKNSKTLLCFFLSLLIFFFQTALLIEFVVFVGRGGGGIGLTVAIFGGEGYT